MKVHFEEYEDDKIINNKGPRLIDNKNDQNDTIIFLVLLFLFSSRLFWSILPNLFINFYEKDWYTPISILIELLWAITPLSLAFTVKEISKRKIVLIGGIIYLLHGLYDITVTFL